VHASHVSAGRQGSNGSTVATVVGSGSGSCATAVQLRILWHQEVFSKVRTLMVRQSRRATEQTMTQSRMARRGGDRTHHKSAALVEKIPAGGLRVIDSLVVDDLKALLRSEARSKAPALACAR